MGHVDQIYNEKIEIEKVILVDDLFVDSNITNDSGLVLNTGVGEPPYSDNTIEGLCCTNLSVKGFSAI
ncbi:hypothetical protein N5E66_04250 [Acinetobacter johnsonii]|uniref:hypothetical protein n=1 Tax=Acinetobacter johnsonii TaxID=40214 RepID=UPI00244D4FC1|nr:hypothetical protein [Acinetobacter johnsonii]MDH1490430.1 hypothetical protein [Acinetobacter johnsonii]MDH1613389.1 hypothetical protein [Acinetobacter johnsonii]